jgi:hypothetical protein
MAIELTDEMRKAVLDEICLRDGHTVDLTNLLGSNSSMVGPEGQLPHIVCSRCKRVWLVVETPALDYETAEENAVTQLASETPFRKRIEELRDRRKAQKK